MLPCAGASLAMSALCPFYRPESQGHDENRSGDRVLPLDAVRTVDGAPAPPVHDTIMIDRGPHTFLGGSHTLRTFALAAADEHRLKLPCAPGESSEVDRKHWPDTRGTDPPEWNPPAWGTSTVTSCSAGHHDPYYHLVIREQRREDVRYFLVTDFND